MSEPGLPESRVHRLRVREVAEETRDSHSLVFAAPEDAGDAFDYRPGQFLTLRIPGTESGSVARCYSLSSAPHEDSLKITVKRVADGYGSNWVCDNIVAGSNVEVLPPAGVFTPRSLDADLLLLAGGSGITPVISILKSVLERGSGRIVLVYANRDEHSVIFAAELRRLAEQHPDRLTVVHWLESVQGLPVSAALRTLVEPFTSYDAFVCGPGAFMDAATRALKSSGMPKDRIHVERFVSLEQNPFEAAEPSRTEPPSSVPDQQDAVVEVELDGGRHRFTWPRYQRLLDLLLERGLDAPYSCRQGACSACACRIAGGEVKMLNNAILDQEDLDDGIVLACQSVPLTDEVHVSYE